MIGSDGERMDENLSLTPAIASIVVLSEYLLSFWVLTDCVRENRAMKSNGPPRMTFLWAVIEKSSAA